LTALYAKQDGESLQLSLSGFATSTSPKKLLPMLVPARSKRGRETPLKTLLLGYIESRIGGRWTRFVGVGRASYVYRRPRTWSRARKIL